MRKILLFAAMLTFALTGCTDNDDKEPTIDAPAEANAIVGQWKLISKRTGADASSMVDMPLATCEDQSTLTFYNGNDLKQNNYGGADCALMTEVFSDWQYNGGNDYHWGEEGVAGFVFVTFSADQNQMTTLKYDGAGYLSETYQRQ